jgi:uncharacterized repeat protein (TIGR01451 family)
VTVVDPLTGQNITNLTLAPGASQTFATSYTLTQADLDTNGGGDGVIDNTATADSDQAAPDSASALVPLVTSPALTIDKSFVDVTGGNGNAQADAAGDVVNYTITVQNTGNVTLTGVTVVDPLTGQIISGMTLAPGASQTFNTSYMLTQADLDGQGKAGSDHDIDNTARARSNETTGLVSDSVQVPLVFNPTLAIEKTFVNVTGGNNNGQVDAVGDVLNYAVTVTNNGNVTLTGVTVVDPLTGQNISGVTLAPGASQTFNSSYMLTQADLDGQGNAGSDHDIDNTATASSNESGAVTDSAEVPLVFNPALNITKDVSGITGGTADAAGDVITYAITVENTGNVTLTGVSVADPNADSGSLVRGADIAGNNDNTLDVGETWSFTASHTVTQAELNDNGGSDGDIDNTATATSDQAAPDSADAAVPLITNPSLNITKDVSGITGGTPGGEVDSAGDVIDYVITIQNTGNVDLTGVTVIDPRAETLVRGADIAGNNDNVLDVGETWSFTASHAVTQAEIDNNGGGDGDIDNTAIATSDQAAPDIASAPVPLITSPALTINKAFVNVTGGNNNGQADAAGDVLNYTVTVENTGNVTLTGVTVVDPLTGQDITGLTLAPGASQAFNSSYTLTQADLDSEGNAGSDHDIDNTATADSNETNLVSDSAEVPLVFSPALNITKDVSSITGGTPGGEVDSAGDVINYAITVENTGNVTLTGVSVADPNADSGSLVRGSDIVGNNDNILDVGETWSFTASHTVTQAELDTNGGGDGDIDNTAIATSDQAAPDIASAPVPLITNAALTINKAFVNVTGGNNNGQADAAGDVLNYTVVTNTSNVTLTGVTVTDPLTGQNITIPSLAPGASQTFNTSYTLTQADLDGQGNAGSDHDIDNTATADSNETNLVSDSAEVPLVFSPALNITKDVSSITGGTPGGAVDSAGDVVNYAITVDNTGNVTLTGVTVSDPNADSGSLVRGSDIVGNNDNILHVGETWSFTANHTVTQAELDANGGSIDNTATADSTESAPDSASASVPLVTSPELTIDKAFVNVTGGNGNTQADAVGDMLNYTVNVTNTGNVTLTGVTVVDPLTGQNISGVTLAPGASQTFKQLYADAGRSRRAGQCRQRSRH